MVMVQIESEKGAENIDSILDTSGLDLVFIGPSDMTHSYGRGREEAMRDGVLRVVRACRKRGVSTGIHHTDLRFIDRLVREGLRLVSCNTEIGALIGAFSGAATSIHSLLSGAGQPGNEVV
jgi:2-keto-3-deoxy-L-rhamnonate aldolase RhmA